MAQNVENEAQSSDDFDRVAVVPGFLQQTIPTRPVQSKVKSKRNANLTMRNWCINVGGLEGLWRLLHVVDGLSQHEKPNILCVQETACNATQWLAVKAYMQKRGYDGYHTGVREFGSVKKRKDAHRGIITFTAQSLRTRWNGDFSWIGGQFHALTISDVLYVNYYVAPSEEEKASQIS